LLKQLLPDLHVNSIYEIDVDALHKRGVKGIITDLDNTLVGAKEPLATPELVVWLKHIQSQGFKVVIVSNNQRTRVAKFAEPLSIPFIHGAKKPGNAAFRKALSQMNLKAEETVVIGDQMLTDVLGGNRLGLYTILVIPISREDEGFFTRVNRRIERVVLARLKKKGLLTWEDKS
jgi:HAD superfamily phosphatase (TIGR01668 family)